MNDNDRQEDTFKILVDLHDSLVLSGEYSNTSVTEFIRNSSALKNASKYLLASQYTRVPLDY